MQQQLRLLEDPPPAGVAPVWNSLDEAQRAEIVKKLAQVIAKIVANPQEPHE